MAGGSSVLTLGVVCAGSEVTMGSSVVVGISGVTCGAEVVGSALGFSVVEGI